jgi:hypothetical protein
MGWPRQETSSICTNEQEIEKKEPETYLSF